VPAHPITDEVETEFRVDEEVILVELAGAAHVGCTVRVNLHQGRVPETVPREKRSGHGGAYVGPACGLPRGSD
jgi:hypothetical protein